ncbi:hypothetical protein [Natronorubrum sp. FCH18a]|uniref:hypothetical protein n=1 Tax=Natronorubrum sp. FCH18a TaxID=3447018 RepID=UPI003F514508
MVDSNPSGLDGDIPISGSENDVVLIQVHRAEDVLPEEKIPDLGEGEPMILTSDLDKPFRILSRKEDWVTMMAYTSGEYDQDEETDAIKHLRDSPGVSVVEQDRPHDPREIYDIYVDLPVFPGHEVTRLYDAGFEVSVDFEESKLIAATSFDDVEKSDPDE